MSPRRGAHRLHLAQKVADIIFGDLARFRHLAQDQSNLIDLGETMKSLLAALLLLGVLSGCVQNTPRNLEAEWAVDKQNYDRSLAGWIGASESALVDHWGAPDRIYTLDASKYVMYRLPRYRLCEQTFKITKGVVEQYTYNVRGCYIRQPTRYYYY